MALPPVPPGYNSWNEYIELEAPELANVQGITLQQAKASLKLLDVAKPIRSDSGQPYAFRIYNEFDTWANRAVLPDIGRPWRLGAGPAPGTFIVTTPDDDVIQTLGGDDFTTL